MYSSLSLRAFDPQPLVFLAGCGPASTAASTGHGGAVFGGGGGGATLGGGFGCSCAQSLGGVDQR